MRGTPVECTTYTPSVETQVGDGFELSERVVGFRAGQAYLDARLAGGALLQFARSAQGDHPPVVHDGHAVAEPLGLFDVMSGQQDGLAARA